MFFTLIPPILISPLFTSQKREMSPAAVVFPPPDGPTKATVSPGITVREISRIASDFPPLYRKETLLNSTELFFGNSGIFTSGRGFKSRIE